MKLKKSTKRLSIFILIGIILLAYSYFETRWIKVTNVSIESYDLPKSFSGKKIVFVSDIHYGVYFSIERVRELVLQINELKPDIIILGGDYTYLNSQYIKPFFDEFSKVKSKYGIYGILGNHDYFVDAALTTKMMLRNGIRMCDNKSYWVKIKSDSIKIGGVGFKDERYEEINYTISDVKRKDFCILIFHRPYYIDKINTDLIDLTLSGHTHGGQITFFGLWAPIIASENGLWASVFPSKHSQKYRYGLINPKPHMQSYITSGVGTIFPPLRFFCRPEIVVLELKRK
jgi:hypothetical protein